MYLSLLLNPYNIRISSLILIEFYYLLLCSHAHMLYAAKYHKRILLIEFHWSELAYKLRACMSNM